MFSRFVTGLYMLAGLALATIPASANAAYVDLLSAGNATWSASVGKSTCTFGPRSSGDSLVATWKVDSGGWADTWVSIVATLSVTIAGADSIDVFYKDANLKYNPATGYPGFSIRFTQSDGTMWQPAAYLNGLVGPQAVTFPLNSTVFVQQFTTGGVFNVANVTSVSFVNNTNPTLLTAASPDSGVFTITKAQVILGASAVKPAAEASSRVHEGFSIASKGFFAPKAGTYTVALYGANGVLIRQFTDRYTAGFNAIDFAKLGSGVRIAKVTGNGFTGSGRLVIDK